MCLQYILSCWWFNQPILKNICSSNWIISPTKSGYLSCHHLDHFHDLFILLAAPSLQLFPPTTSAPKSQVLRVFSTGTSNSSQDFSTSRAPFLDRLEVAPASREHLRRCQLTRTATEPKRRLGFFEGEGWRFFLLMFFSCFFFMIFRCFSWFFHI